MVVVFCAGNPHAEAAILAWADRHARRTRRFYDAYAFSAWLIRASGEPPELLFFSADALHGENGSLLGQVRRKWPEARTVIVGESPIPLPAGMECVRFVRTVDLPHYLRAESPDGRSTTIDAARRAQSVTSGALTVAFAKDPGRSDVAPSAARQPAATESPVSALRSDAPARSTDEPQPEGEAVLTQEELAALLEDLED